MMYLHNPHYHYCTFKEINYYCYYMMCDVVALWLTIIFGTVSSDFCNNFFGVLSLALFYMYYVNIFIQV